ncbi:MAG: NUDIX domain-containing protein [Bradyrhizobium sp.]
MITRLTDESDIERAVAGEKRRLREEKLPEAWADVGVVFEDQYLRIVRDAVKFPSGRFGTYIKIERPNGVKNGVIGIPRMRDSYLLVKHWRYATQCFHLEFPRGFTDFGEEPSDAINREMLEEISAEIVSVQLLGTIFNDTGLMNFPINVYSVEVSKYAIAGTEEGIDGIEVLTEAEIRDRIRFHQINDSLTLAAFSLAMALS